MNKILLFLKFIAYINITKLFSNFEISSTNIRMILFNKVYDVKVMSYLY